MYMHNQTVLLYDILIFSFQVMIMLSGNYNFFNFLYLALCLSLADNSWLEVPSTPPHLLSSCLCCIIHLATYVALGWAVGQAFHLQFTSSWTVESSVAFSTADFGTFLSYAVPTGLILGLLSLVWAAMISLRKASKTKSPLRSLLTTVFHLFLAVGFFCLSLPSYSGQLDRPTYDALPRAFKEADRSLGALQLTNSYGLFRRMTGLGGRPEVVLEGALNPQGPWQEFEFLYKPGNTSEAPKFMLPHQPRLDWQMWFAALGSYQQNPWLVSLAYRLLEGREEVSQLMSPSCPWRNKTPRYVRAKKFTYTFTEDPQSKDWWQRKEDGEYLPILTRDNKGLQEYLAQQNILGPWSSKGTLGEEPWVKPSPYLLPILAKLRQLSDACPPHIQIWSYAWLALPILKPFVI